MPPAASLTRTGRGLDPLWYLEERGQENSPTAFACVSRILQTRPLEDSPTLDPLLRHLHSLAKVLFTSFLTVKLALKVCQHFGNFLKGKSCFSFLNYHNEIKAAFGVCICGSDRPAAVWRDDDAPGKGKRCPDNSEQLVWSVTPACTPSVMSALCGTNFNQVATAEKQSRERETLTPSVRDGQAQRGEVTKHFGGQEEDV